MSLAFHLKCRDVLHELHIYIGISHDKCMPM